MIVDRKRGWFFVVPVTMGIFFGGVGEVWGVNVTRANSSVTATVVTGAPDSDILDDFNDNNDRDYWDGVIGAVEETPNDGSIVRSYETSGAFAGRSLKLTYDLTQDSDWNGFYMNLNNESSISKNIAEYKQLSFQIKGAVGGQEHLKIVLENTSDAITNRNRAAIYVNDYLDGGITNSWQKVSIPLDAFSGLDSFSNAKTLSFVFEKTYVADTVHPLLADIATVYIDDVRFSTTLLPTLRIDHFGDNWGLNALGGNWGNMAKDGYVNPTLTYISSLSGTEKWSMASTYNVEAAGSWQGHYCLFGGGASGWAVCPLNISSYRYFKFKIRAVSSSENPSSIKIELVSGTKRADIIVTDITTTFQTLTIDLNSAAMAAFVDKTAFKQINVVYEESRIGAVSGDKRGTLYFDDLHFSTVP